MHRITFLDAFKPLIRANAFIGQASSATIMGLTQKEQQGIIENFTNGIYNVLAATCIGEEGLGMDYRLCLFLANTSDF